ncbi:MULTISPECIES: DUF3093 domain-containing protein [unclassified Actinotalea]|uniref:DUF3093 domain-containing protein n=1 Tax=unclassified Actinotalea TaxID=2638618 RepID=UPI0015F731A3|nr:MULTISPECIES: DUF3093 domain-containing protein [unclassified Actinotalea]
MAPHSTDVLHRERLWPGPLGWCFVIGFAVLMVIALLPVRGDVALVGGVVSLLVAIAAAVRTSAPVEVAGGELRAGRAHIPVALLGAARVLDRDGVRAQLGPGSDARTYVCLRAWIPGAVVVVVDDPQDPTPAWVVSTRRPQALVAALDAARRSGQAAHSEQIG